MLNFQRLGKYKSIARLTLFLSLVAWYFFIDFTFKLSLLKEIVLTIGISTFISGVFFYFRHSGRAIDLFRTYFSEINFRDYLGIQAEIQKELIVLLKTWIPPKKVGSIRLVLFVDDIDRCSEDKIIEVIDSFKVMMDDPFISKRVITIAAIDEVVLKRAINTKYFKMINRDLELSPQEKAYQLERLCREYMDKLFINGFKLGGLSNNDKAELFRNLTDEKTFFRNDEHKGESYTPEVNSPVNDNGGNTAETAPGTNQGAAPNAAERNIGSYISLLPNEAFEIMDYELQYLLKAVERYRNATPRSIRIFYYRYLLAKSFKNIFIPAGSDIFNEWNLDQDRKAILPYLIVEYSANKTHKDLLLEVETLDSSENFESTVTCLGQSFSLPKDLYSSLLKVVEIVVPY